MRSFLVVLPALAWCCDGSKGDAAPSPDSVQPGAASETPRDTTPLGQWISQMAKGPDTNLTLGGWLAGHPADIVSDSIPTGMRDEPFCSSASAPITAETRVWRRSAVFVIPPPPADQSLPDTNGLAERLCRLRAFWLEGTAQDSLQADEAARALQAMLSQPLGEGKPENLLTGPGTGRWREMRAWSSGPRVVAVGADPGGSFYLEPDTALRVRPPMVMASSFIVGNGLDTSVISLVEQDEYPKVDPEALVAMARADSAIARSGLAGLAPLRRVFSHHLDSTRFKKDAQRPPPDASVDSLLLHTLAALRDTLSLPPPQRSAAFLAADIALQTHSRWLDYQGQDTVFRQELERAGAPYDYDQLGAVWIYLRPWLWRAYQLDSLGPSGKSAFAELLREGWTTAIACGGGSDMTGEVITRGERALQAGHADPMVHLYLAQAYADIFSLMPEGDDASASDSARALAARAETARRRAIEHYRQGLAGVRDPGLRRRTWNQTVRLMLGRPIATRYFCEYD
ncbi:MAG TPA: hypothetical protein VF252_09440 [Gemmatimonadales bacterium]